MMGRPGKLLFVFVFAAVTVLSGMELTVGAAEPSGLLCDRETIYSYEDMKKDIVTLQREFPDLLHVDSLGKTIDGRDICHLTVGNMDAKKHILIFASIHAREYITTPLVMKQTSALLRQASASDKKYRDISFRELLHDTAVHIVPMVNPDGVTLSQFGLEGMQKSSTRQGIYRIYEMDNAVELGPYLRRWKSNAEGVDINRNFDALWEAYDDHLGHPSSDHYKGTAVGCTAEAKALIDLTKKFHFDRTISYHVQGEVIYWYFAQEGSLLTESKAFAKAISNVTGYPLDSNYEKLDPAGYKDWAIQKMGIPSLTLEVGSGEVPLNMSQLADIYERNKNVLYETLYSVR